jgi:hypothetical protein
MTIGYGPSIVTSGLVLALDAADRNSYPGSGTTWTDLSGLGNNGTLVNGVGYNSGNLGSLVFDGTNDFVNCGNSTTLNMSTETTLIHWLKFTGSTWSPFIGKLTNATTNNYRVWLGNDRGFDVEMTNDSFKPLFTVTSGELPTNSWCCLGMRFKSDGTLSGFFNGVKKNTVAKNIGATNNGDFIIGTDSGGTAFGGGSISCIQLYNRALSDAEIQQNFNALRGRYGI